MFSPWLFKGILGFACGMAATFPSVVFAELITNLPQTVTHGLLVQPIIVSNDDGSSTATFLGSAAQESGIKQGINQIWAQAGIEIQWLPPNFWNSSFANMGTVPPPGTRPASEFEPILAAGQSAGVAGALPITSMYFINIVPGFPAPGSLFGIEGLATVGGPGSTIRVGSSLHGAVLVGDPLGQQLVAKVIAHEIGHNLGLLHIEETANLMLANPTPPQDGIYARLNGGQITLARSSGISNGMLISVPEPSAVALLWMSCLMRFCPRRRPH